MSRMPHSTNPVTIAKEMGAIAKETKSPTFEKAARWTLIASAVITAAAGLFHAAHTLIRDMTRPEGGHGRRQAEPVPQAPAHAADAPSFQVSASEHPQSWVSKTQLDRSDGNERHGHGRRH